MCRPDDLPVSLHFRDHSGRLSPSASPLWRRSARRRSPAPSTVSDPGAAAARRPVVLMQKPKDRDFIQAILQRLNLGARSDHHLAGGAGMERPVNSVSRPSSSSSLEPCSGLNIPDSRVLVDQRPGSRGRRSPCLPYLFVLLKRKRRFAEIRRSSSPRALDFLARSMRAGHAFSISLEMLGQETPDPLGREIRALYNEQNLGAARCRTRESRSTRAADRRPVFCLNGLCRRQTGGNLSEILTWLAHVIRERFRLRGQVKAASAHGRDYRSHSDAMPLVVTVAMMFVAPNYLALDGQGSRWQIHDPGRHSRAVGWVLLSIRRIVNIKV